MKYHRLSLHLITSSEKGYFNQHGAAFDSQFYSRFKYGCHASAAFYADELSRRVSGEYMKWKDDEVFITGSAYKVAPTASGAIADLLYLYLRPAFANIRTVKINRESIFPNDYGSLSFAERSKLMEQNRLWVDADLLRGKKLIVVDDLRVTGAHERKILELLDGVVAEILFVYVGQIIGGEHLPTAEAHINHAAIRSLQDLKQIVNRGRFHVNARICKYVLSYPHKDEVDEFLRSLPGDILESLYFCINGDGYNLMPEYEANFKLLNGLIEKEAAYKAA